MSQFPHDRFNKNLFELRLSPFGEVSTQRPIDPETTFIDIYFVPQQPIAPEPQLSLLAKCINDQAVVFEPLDRTYTKQDKPELMSTSYFIGGIGAAIPR